MSNDTKTPVKLETARSTATEKTAHTAHVAAESTSRATHAAVDSATRTAHAAQNACSAINAEFTRWFSDIKMPNAFNVQAMTEFHRRNIESLNTFFRIALEGTQACTRRQMDVYQQLLRELCEAARQLASTESTQTKVTHQLDAAKRRFEITLSNVQELQDMARRSTNESLDVINQRIAEALTEVKAMIESCHQSHARPV